MKIKENMRNEIKIPIKNKYKILLTILFWIAIFDPPFIRAFNVIHLVGLISWIYIIYNKVVNKSAQNIFLKSMITILLLYIYFALVIVLNGENGILTSYHLYWLADIIPFSYAISNYLYKHNINFEEYEKALIYSGVVSSVLTILALVFPKLQNIFINQYINAGYSKVYFEAQSFRTFGFANNLQYSSSIVLSLIGLIAVNYAIKYNKLKYILFAIIMVFSGFINARTTLVVFLFSLPIVLLFNIKNVGRAFKYGLIVISFIIILFFVLINLPRSTQVNWLLDAYYDLLSLFSDDFRASYSIIDYYSSDTIFLPDNLFYLWFGSGTYVFTYNRFNLYTDIGYINDVWHSGIIYTLLSYLSCILLFRKSQKHLNEVAAPQGTILFLFLIAVFLLGNVKGILFSFNSITTTFWIICSITASYSWKI